MKQLYKAAVIGCGRIGLLMGQDPNRVKPATHAEAYALSDDVELVALVDTSKKQLTMAQSIYPNTAIYEDPVEMLKEHKPSIVSIATGPETHKSLVELCADSGVRAIICEKPIATSVGDAESMIEVCRKKGSILFINHSRRFDSLLGQVAAEIQEGALGEILQVSCYYTAGLYNSGTHLVDLIRFMTGVEIDWVTGFKEKRFPAPHEDINVNGFLVDNSGLMISLQVLDVEQYLVFKVYVYGSKGVFVIDNSGFTIRRIKVGNSQFFKGYKEIEEQSVKEGESRSFMSDMVRNAVDCIEDREKPASSGEDGLRALVILEALKESAEQEGKRVSIEKND